MKKIFSIATIALFAISFVLTSCRNDASTSGSETTTQETPAAAPAAADTTTAAAPAAADTTQQAQ
jgi:predicted small secreted protein